MKTYGCFLLVLIFTSILIGCTSATSNVPVQRTPQAKIKKPVHDLSITECPLGHKSIKHVPITYGLLMSSPELKKNIEDLNVWPGGCIKGGENFKIVCSECRYSYETYKDAWMKLGSGRNSFGFKLNKIVFDFPVIEAIKGAGSLRVSQMVKDKKSVFETLNYLSESTMGDIDKKIQVYLAKTKMGFKREKENSKRINFKTKVDDYDYFVSLTYLNKNYLKVYVSVSGKRPF